MPRGLLCLNFEGRCVYSNVYTVRRGKFCCLLQLRTTDAEVILHDALNDIVDPTEGSEGGRASAVQVGVVEGRYLPPALCLLGPANIGRTTLLILVACVRSLATATFPCNNGAPLGHEVALGA